MATETTGAQVKLRAVEMDHIVLRVKDVERALHFYTEIIGLAPYRVEEYRSGQVPFPCARINGHTIIDLLPWTQDEPVGDGPRNMDHFCLTIEPTDLVGLSESLKGQGVDRRERRARSQIGSPRHGQLHLRQGLGRQH